MHLVNCFSSKYQADVCLVCGNEFVCKVGNISQCDCGEIELSTELSRVLRDEVGDCVCVNCLKKLSKVNNISQLNRSELVSTLKYTH